MQKNIKKFDYLVIGGGSGGVASSRWAAKYGISVGLIEHKRLGGTCVNVGCVPKKICYNAASFIEEVEVARSYCINQSDLQIDWRLFKQKRDAEILRLNGIYTNLLKNSGVEYIKGLAKFIDEKTVECEGQLYSSDNILIATGSKSRAPTFEGTEHAINSDGFFDLEELPQSVLVSGGGYIGVEIGQIFSAFGVKTSLITQSDVLSSFDQDIRKHLTDAIIKQNINLEKNTRIKKIDKNGENQYTVELENGKTIETNLVLVAQGRIPNIEGLGLENTSIKLDEKTQSIIVDDFENTNVEGIYALGDVTGKIQLTPVAVRAGRMLSERLFNKKPDLKMDYTFVPTVVFSHPPIGTIGLTEQQAKKQYGENNIAIYTSKFSNMHYSFMNPEDKPVTFFKLICVKDEDEKIVGLHGIGRGMDEMLQGFSVAIKMGATKKQFDSVVAIHPTASEEFVTMQPKY